jgi:dipeptidase D
VRAWAGGHGFPLAEDAAGNLVVRVPPTPGRESAPVLILQGHLDMVCERDPSSPNDPAQGRIVLVREGDRITADGTTLGADNGVAVAAMLALAGDPSLPHGPLELLLTVAEEVGMDGANALDGSLLRGRTMLNLDGEDDTMLTVGCAGSTDTWIRIGAPREACRADAAIVRVDVDGVRGGHSGGDIHAGRANAIKVLGRVLRVAHASLPFLLVSLEGGRSRNAIPRDAVAVCAVPGGHEDELREAVERAAATVRATYERTDPGLTVRVAPAAWASDGWTAESTARLLDVVALVPTGPLGLSPDVPGLVETSSSLAEASTTDGTLTLHSLSRGADAGALAEVVAVLDAVARRTGGTLEVKHNYDGWRPALDSPVLATARRVYEELFGEQPGITAVHGGLEPAVIGSKVPGLDMLALGPLIEAPHSPDERVSIPSVERFWRLLVALVDDLSERRES